MTPNTLIPKLQAPGAGLPLIQMIFVRLWLKPFVSKRTPLSQCRKTYEMLTSKLIENISKISPELRNEKVLVDPIRGLEDSSRYWSLNQVLEHLLIVSRGIEQSILSLSAGVVPGQTVDIAKVKPGLAERNLLAEFQEYAPGLMWRLDEMADFKSTLKFRHPWFGALTARQWYWLLSSHQGIHCWQAKMIIRGL